MQDNINNGLTILITVIIMSIIMLDGVKLLKKDDNKKRRDNIQFGKESFCFQFGKSLIVICGIGALFFLAIFIVNVITFLGISVLGKGISLGTVIFFGLFDMFYLICFFGFYLWRININGEEIVYRNAIGITKKYTFNDITGIRQNKKGRVVVFMGKRKIFAIDDFLPFGPIFVALARQRGIQIDEIKEKS